MLFMLILLKNNKNLKIQNIPDENKLCMMNKSNKNYTDDNDLLVMSKLSKHVDLKYFNNKEDKESMFYIDSKNARQKINILIDKISPDNKFFSIYVSNFLSSKLYNIFTLNNDDREKIINKTSDIIYYGEKELPKNIRFLYFNFCDTNISLGISLSLYTTDIEFTFDLDSYINIIKHILQCHETDQNIKNKILDDIRNKFDATNDRNIRANIADIFFLTGLINEGNQRLDMMQDRDRKSLTIYEDVENVHNPKISQSCKDVAFRLIDIYNKTDFDPDIIIEDLKKYCDDALTYDELEDLILRIKVDTSVFGYDRTTIMNELFANVWEFIINNEYYDELKKILINEFVESKYNCSSGLFSRLINAIQGYSTDESLSIKMSDEDRIRGIIFQYITSEICEKGQYLLDDFSQNNICEFIKMCAPPKITELIEEGEDIQLILNAIKKYTQENKWMISSNGDLLLEM